MNQRRSCALVLSMSLEGQSLQLRLVVLLCRAARRGGVREARSSESTPFSDREKPAPFLSRNGSPYLEVHHIIALANGGTHHPSNLAAVCPNCHTRVTHGKDGNQFNAEIKRRVTALENALNEQA
jgi:5-methylcytosine-specific restriction endonuclease McrA